jgi:hypothetical protein
MDKVGQLNAVQSQNAAVANRQHLDKTAQIQAQKAQTVSETKRDSESSKIKADVNQGGGSGQTILQDGEKREKNENLEQQAEKKSLYEIKDPKLGQRIDISG